MPFQRSLTRLLLTLPTLAATFALGLAACGDDTGTTPEAKYTLENVCVKIAPELCAVREPCCLQGNGFDETACIAYETEVCEKNVADVRAGVMTFDGNTIDACLVALEPYADKCFLAITDYFTAPQDFEPCSKVFAGTLKEGTVCERDAQCEFSLGDRELVACGEMTKKCETTRFLPKDASCVLSQDTKELCDQGLYCDYDFLSMEGACITAKKVGDACNPSPIQFSCGIGAAYCDGTTKVCTEAKGEGAACQSLFECKSLKCEMALCARPDPLFDGAQCKGTP